MYIHTYIISQTCSKCWISKLGGYKLFLFDASRKYIRFLGEKSRTMPRGGRSSVPGALILLFLPAHLQTPPKDLGPCSAPTRISLVHISPI